MQKMQLKVVRPLGNVVPWNEAPFNSAAAETENAVSVSGSWSSLAWSLRSKFNPSTPAELEPRGFSPVAPTQMII